MFKNSWLSAFFFFGVPSLAQTPVPSSTPVSGPVAPSHSLVYEWLEDDSPARKAFIKAHNQATEAILQASANYIPMQNRVYQLSDRLITLKQVSVDATHTLRLLSRGLGKSTDLVLSTPGGTDAILTSNFYLFGVTTTDEFIDFNVSPDQKYIAIITAKDGSIDGVDVHFYDFVNRAMIADVLPLTSNNFFWISPTQVLYDLTHSDGTISPMRYDLITHRIVENPGGFAWQSNAGYTLMWEGGSYQLRNAMTGTDVPVLGLQPLKIISADDANVYVLVKSADQHNELRAFAKNSTAPNPGTVLISSPDRIIQAVYPSRDAFFILVRNGPDRLLRFYDAKGVSVGEVLIPDATALSSAVWTDPAAKTSVKVNLYSAVKTTATFTYDLIHGTWDRDPNSDLLSQNGISYTSSVEYAKSSDGTRIPVRLTYRSDLKKNQSNPVLFNSYGGFNLAGSLDPAYDNLKFEFLRRGGILAGPGLRGGNEYDEPWHQQAMREGKIKTYQDLSASAKMLIDEGWTTSALTTSMGTSNGGLTVAATALLYPNLFGLVIPCGGVHDFLGRDRLDPEFKGWDSEFGVATDASQVSFYTAISPLENTQARGTTEFLIIDGKDDTRVNIAHSLKLTAALEAEPNPLASVHLLSVKHAGHAVESVSTSNLNAWKTETAIWTKIFDRAGWKVETP